MRKEGESVVREIVQELLNSFSHLEVAMLPEQPAQQLLVGVSKWLFLFLTRVSPLRGINCKPTPVSTFANSLLLFLSGL